LPPFSSLRHSVPSQGNREEWTAPIKGDTREFSGAEVVLLEMAGYFGRKKEFQGQEGDEIVREAGRGSFN